MEQWHAKHHKDRLVRARKARPCTAWRCTNIVEAGEQYLDHDPPERQNGYFALCLPCAERLGYIESCGNPIHCSVCLAEKATKSTARRAAARKGAATRNRRRG